MRRTSTHGPTSMAFPCRGRSLHHLDARLPNPYEQALAIVARTLSSFDEDQLIPCYGFGDVTTHDRAVFSFNPNGAPCKGLEACLTRLVRRRGRS